MGTCLSKKKSKSYPTTAAVAGSPAAAEVPDPKKPQTTTTSIPKTPPFLQVEKDLNFKKQQRKKAEREEEKEREEKHENPVKKEIFVIKHRKSKDGRDKDPACSSTHHEQEAKPAANTDSSSSSEGAAATSGSMGLNMGVVRTSSCTKEEVDAILIQCGRLSRSSSGKAPASSARKYSGSKRSYDFDAGDLNDLDGKSANSAENDDDMAAGEQQRWAHRIRHRSSSTPSPSKGRRRRTPSRERDPNQRSRSQERRVSRSPGRRSLDTSLTNTATSGSNNANGNVNGGSNANANNGGSARPVKMVSVPATVSSLAMDKRNNGIAGGDVPGTVTAIKRNVGEAMASISSSPRSQLNNASAAKTLKENNNNNQAAATLSRSNSRKAEVSPCRRNPLSEIDTNSIAHQQLQNNNNNKNSSMNKVQNRNKKEVEVEGNQRPKGEKNKKMVEKTCVSEAAAASQKPQGITRSRSARKSRELDFNPETLLNNNHTTTPSDYTTLLLEDIHNFHQKNVITSVSLPACLTKACSIVEAVADLNSTTSSNLSCAYSEDRRSPPTCQSKKKNNMYDLSYGKVLLLDDKKDPFVESEVGVDDDVMEPTSFHNYVTVRRGGGGDTEDQESSGSNSFVGQQNWGLSSSSWEPNSADSIDCSSSRATAGGSQEDNKSRRRMMINGKRRESDNTQQQQQQQQQSGSGIGRGRLGAASRGAHTISDVVVSV